MGQYHRIYNITKKETLRIGGAKLWEQAHSATAAALLLLLSNSNGRGGGDFNTYPQNYDKLTPLEEANNAIIDTVSGRWAGDKIVVQGDYADENDAAYLDLERFDSFRDISHMVCDALLIADDGDDSDMAKTIEAEARYQPYSSRVEKVETLDRNNQIVKKYQATGYRPNPSPKKKRGAK